MAADRVIDSLIDALKRGLAQPGEHRLFRSGKLDGLFAARNGAPGEAATRALREGLVEVVRAEARGKTTIDWVRLTPRAVEFLHGHESPVRALQDLRRELQTTRDGVPAWQAELRQALGALGDKLTQEAQRLAQRLDALSQRVDEALERLALVGPNLPEGVAQAIPWAKDALDYLERRKSGGVATPCPLPELFAAVAAERSEFSLPLFHEGLRQLKERRLVTLQIWTSESGEMAQPEYALLDGGSLYYAITR